MKVYATVRKETFDDIKRLNKRKPEQIVAKLRDADAMLNAGKDLPAASR
jgi:hypothetical protein